MPEFNSSSPIEELPVDFSTTEEPTSSFESAMSELQSTSDFLNPMSSNVTSESQHSGMTAEELSDPNRIEVSIADGEAPLVVLFGPPSCGKTMTLVRLTRFLATQGYQVAPIRTFRPSYDTHYRGLCDSFNTMVNQVDAARSTNLISFMLVEVLKDGRRVCQILEAPGEYYFDPQKPQNPFPAYVNKIIHSNNRKVWCTFIEPDWQNETDRANYVQRITQLKTQMRPKDKTVFVFNKIDKTNFVIGPGQVHLAQARKEVDNLFRGLFQPFRNLNPITSFFSPWRCQFVPFQTGTYTQDREGRLTYQQGADEYPRMLWRSIQKYLKG